MKTLILAALAVLAGGAAARADFSYTQSRTTTGGMMADAAPATPPSKMYFKGQKMKSETGNTAVILDFEAQTITNIDNAAKTYTVKNFSDMAAPANQANVQIDVKETGQRKNVNGFDARELAMSMASEFAAGRAGNMQVQMEIDNWISSGVPGAAELREFYRKNADRFPWAALGGGGNPQIQQAMAAIQRKMASMDGIPVQQILRVRPSGGAGMPQAPQMTAAQSARMAQAQAQLQQMAQQGGPAAAAAQAAMARMGNMPGVSGASSAGTVMMEITMESHDFSSAPIADSVFAIPAGYRQK